MLQRLANIPIDLGRHPQLAVLIGAAGRQDGPVHGLGVVSQLLPRLLGHLPQQSPLPAGIQGGHLMCLFIPGHLCAHCHPLFEQLHHFLIDRVDLPTQCLHLFVHWNLLLADK